MDEVTKLDQVEKTDPQLVEKTSELLAIRLEEEKRKAELREEMRMARAREDARARKVKQDNVLQPQEMQSIVETPPVVTPTHTTLPSIETPESTNPNDFVTIGKFNEKVAKINKSFEWLEKYISEHSAYTAKLDKLLLNITKAIEEYNKK